MANNQDLEFSFVKEINEPQTYNLLFPKREVGLAIVLLYEKVIDGTFVEQKFTEKDIHKAFATINKPSERYQWEDFSENIGQLQEYFLDYNQESQKYFFKDYAYKFCEHAKTTLKGAFDPTRIKRICSNLTKSLKAIDSEENLKYWLQDEYKRFEPDLREQIDFLEKQILNSVEQLKSDANFSGKKFIDVLKSVEANLDNAQEQSKELRSAYTETKTIRAILEEKEIEDNEVNILISEVHCFIKYINERLTSIDRKLERIQPKIRQLFSTLNKPQFNSKIQKFTRYLLDKSSIKYQNTQKIIEFPIGILTPVIHMDTPDFTVVEKDRDFFPSKPKKRKSYTQNIELVKKNKQRLLERIEQQDKILKWEALIMSEIDLRKGIDLSKMFFKILEEEIDSQIAVSAIYKVIKRTYKRKDLKLEIEKSKEINSDLQNISLWKMKIIKR